MLSHIPRIGAIALVVALAVPLGATAVHAEVVFGNLGETGVGDISGTNTDIVPVATAAGQFSGLAQGFTTGSLTEFLTLQSVTLGLFADVGVSARTVSLFTNAAGNPGTLVATSSPVNVGAAGLYTFDFGSIPLAANTGYWIVPQPDVSWHVEAAFTNPTAENGSGYGSLGTRAQTFASGGNWTSTGLTSYAVSVTAVPEPSTYALAATALCLCGIAVARRRQTGC